jgi:hypothetical protein
MLIRQARRDRWSPRRIALIVFVLAPIALVVLFSGLLFVLSFIERHR